MSPVVPPALSAADRKIRIQVLRLQADYDRIALQHSLGSLAEGLQPSALVATVRDHLGGASSGWLGAGWRLVRRYPVSLSILTSLLSTPTRRSLALKSALIAGLVWLARRDHAARAHAVSGAAPDTASGIAPQPDPD